MNIIACVDKNWGIGKDGELLFHIRQDMEFFRLTTLNNIVIMGRKTFDALRNKPLPDRTNIVLTKDKNFEYEGVITCHSVEETLDVIKDKKNVFIIGGGEIYKEFLPYCDKAYITKVFAEMEADSHMVNLDAEKDWTLTGETKNFSGENFDYGFFVYERK